MQLTTERTMPNMIWTPLTQPLTRANGGARLMDDRIEPNVSIFMGKSENRTDQIASNLLLL